MMSVSALLGANCLKAEVLGASVKVSTAPVVLVGLSEDTKAAIIKLGAFASAEEGMSVEAISIALYEACVAEPAASSLLLDAVINARSAWQGKDVKSLLNAIVLAVPSIGQAMIAYSEKVAKAKSEGAGTESSEEGGDVKEAIDSATVNNALLSNIFSVLQSAPSVSSSDYVAVTTPSDSSTTTGSDVIVKPPVEVLPPPPVTKAN